MAKTVNKFLMAQYKAQVLNDLYDKLENDLRWIAKRYAVVETRINDDGEEEKIWDYVDIPEDELTPNQLANIQAIQTLEAALEKML